MMDLRTYFAKVDCSAAGANTIVPAIAGKPVRVLNYTLIAAAAVTVKWQSNATDLSGPLSLGSTGGASPQSPLGLLETAPNEPLVLFLGGAVQVSGHIAYQIEH